SGDFAAGLVRHALDGAAEFDLQTPRQDQAVFLLEQVGHPALAGLAVDADDGVVAAADVGRVDRQIWHFPDGVRFLLGKALLDGVLVRTGEGREDQIAGIGVARVDGQRGAAFSAAAHFVDVGEVEAWVDALGVEVHGQRDQADVAGAFAIAEQAAFDPVCARHYGQFGGRDGGSAVIVRVHADDDAVAIAHIATEPFDLIGVHIGRGRLDGGRQIEDDLLFRGGLPDVHDGVADFQRELRLGGAEDFRRVFVEPVGFRVPGRVLLDQLCAGDGDLFDLCLAHVEDDLAEGGRAGVIQVHHGLLSPGAGRHGLADQVFTRLGEHDDGHIVGNALFIDQFAHEVEVGLRG